MNVFWASSAASSAFAWVSIAASSSISGSGDDDADFEGSLAGFFEGFEVTSDSFADFIELVFFFLINTEGSTFSILLLFTEDIVAYGTQSWLEIDELTR